MRLEQSFEVPVPVAQAWNVLLDLEQVVPALPGATLTSFDGTAFTGTVKVKLGPISLVYRGQGRFTERDETGRRVAFVAQGQDSRGAGAASARVNAVLHAADGGSATLVRVVTDLDISGKAAQFGRGLIADVSAKVVKQFADNLAAVISASPGAPTSTRAPEPALPSPQPAAAAPAPPIPAQAQPVEPPAAPPVPPPPAAPKPAPVASEPATPVAPVFPPPPPGWQPPGATAREPIAEPAPAAEPAPTPEPALAAEPTAPEPVAASPMPAPGTGLRQPPVEAEPLDLLAVSGAKGVLRKAAPVLIIVALALVGLIVWLVGFR